MIASRSNCVSHEIPQKYVLPVDYGPFKKKKQKNTHKTTSEMKHFKGLVRDILFSSQQIQEKHQTMTPSYQQVCSIQI